MSDTWPGLDIFSRIIECRVRDAQDAEIPTETIVVVLVAAAMALHVTEGTPTSDPPLLEMCQKILTLARASHARQTIAHLAGQVPLKIH